MLLLHIFTLCDIICKHLFESYPKIDKIHHHKRPDLRDRLFYFVYDYPTLIGMQKLLVGVLALLVALLVPIGVYATSQQQENTKKLQAVLESEPLFDDISTAAPAVEKPAWYSRATITYSIRSAGTIKGNLSEFATSAQQTLNDPRGWAQMDVRFVQVESGGMFTLYLSQASLLPSFSAAGCSVDWSCRAGNNVIINDDRWMGATSSWNAAGGSLANYRHMVVNHEVGHWLGHDHEYCGGAGQLAPVMQQQSMGLQGCSFNPWPLKSELWSSRL